MIRDLSFRCEKSQIINYIALSAGCNQSITQTLQGALTCKVDVSLEGFRSTWHSFFPNWKSGKLFRLAAYVKQTWNAVKTIRAYLSIEAKP